MSGRRINSQDGTYKLQHLSYLLLQLYSKLYGRDPSTRKHHAGRNVNVPLSLNKSPRTGVQELVINLHWTTSNVNYIVNGSLDREQSEVISKDTKAIVLADIAPVQHPGHSWKLRELPDHTWDQSRTNAVTPMTFRFLTTEVSETVSVDGNCVKYVTRTGQGFTLLCLSFFEPGTSFKCMNEILVLLDHPGLDEYI